jgi:phage terminase large subunit
MAEKKIIYLGKAQPKQDLFLRAKTRYVGYGGARGGGKSWAVRTKAIVMAGAHKGIRQLIVRRTYGELTENHINIMREICAPIAKYNDRDKQLRFRNGSVIKFDYCATDKDLSHYQGVQYDIIYLDEATQLTEYQIKQISACLRGVNDFPKRMYMTCNPGGPGHQYIKRIFVDRHYLPGEKPEDYTFIQAMLEDNLALMEKDPEYRGILEALPYRLREAWLYGRWDVFAGQVFDEFTDDPNHYEDRIHTHVIAPFDIPKGWNVYRSYDWGYDKPFSCGWWAVDYEGRIYRICELYGCTGEPNMGVHWPIDKQFDEIKRIEREHPYLAGKTIRGVADPAIWKKGADGISIEEVAARHGIYFEPGSNARIPGWMQCHYRLQFDDEGRARMYVFDNCRAFLRTIPLLQFSDTEPEDLNTEQEDHAADEWRYLCMARPVPPLRPVEERALLNDPLKR